MESQRDTFVVRIERDEVDRVLGIVEHVRTGAKARFEGVEAVGELIARMLALAHRLPPPTP
jgi:hypothetical protein